MHLMFVGPFEIGVVVVLIVVFFGAPRLPQLGAGLGKGLRNFKQSVTGADEKDEVATEEKKKD